MSARISGAVPIEPVVGDVVDSLLEGCQIIDFEFRYRYVNDAVVAQARCAKEELLGRTMSECFPGIDQTPMFERLRRCMIERVHLRMENEFTYPGGSTGHFELRFVPVPQGVCVLSLDVTEEKRTAAALARSEEQLRQAQKMEAVGRLAGGVAHDFNNMLSVVLCYAGMILGDVRSDDPIRADLDEIRKAAQRATELTRQLLAFSRQQVLQPRVLDLNQVITGMEKMIARLLGADIDFTVLRAPDLGKVVVDPGQVEQIVMNLVVNARDAMPRGGKLTLQTKNVSLDEDDAKEHLGVKAGPYAMIALTDTGVGMDRDVQAHLFEPFFTTKEKGQGTGLGLATVFGIVKQSGGDVWVSSEPGEGTTFRLYFPVTERDEAPQSSRTPGGDAGRGSETVLLVEDDEMVRAAARGILRRSGYTVLEASGPGDALLVSEAYGGKIHLLLVDVVMPRMTGPQLAERLLSARRGMKVLFMSGYTNEAMAQHGLLESGIPFLQKPITPENLTRRVRDILGPPPEEPRGDDAL